MEGFEPKKLALIRIWQILKENSDYNHPMTQEDIAEKLENDYGIIIERKAISRNISLLKEAGIEIEWPMCSYKIQGILPEFLSFRRIKKYTTSLLSDIIINKNINIIKYRIL